MPVSTPQKMSRMQLTAMVVGSMVGAGIVSLARTLANVGAELGRRRGGGHCMTCPITRDAVGF